VWLALLVMAAGLLMAQVVPPEVPPEVLPEASSESSSPAEASATTPALAPSPSPLGPAVPTGHQVAVIPIEGEIYEFTLESLTRRVDRALADGATLLVLELDTPGGDAMTGLKISQYLKSLQVPTLAWVNPRAYSAGILIASACDHLLMAPAAATGDCAPIIPGKELSPTERAKALSPLLAEFRANAHANGYDYVLFHAMCELGVKVFMVEHLETGQRRLVNQIDYEVMVHGRDPNDVSTWTRELGWAGGADECVVSREVATDADVGRWKPVTQLPSGAPLPDGLVHDGRTLLTVSTDRAGDIGLSKGQVRTQADLSTFLGAAGITPIPQSWSEDLAGWLTHPLIKGILIMALLVGAYMEFQTPGLGLPGAVAAVALILLLGAPFLVGLAEVWHILLFFIGLVLLIIEVFVTPGFGVLGVTGIVAMIVGLVLVGVPTSGGAGLPGYLPSPQAMTRLQLSALTVVLALVGSGIALYFLSKYIGSIPLFNRLILRNDDAALALAAGAISPPVSGDDALGGGVIQVGAVGRVTTGLRPSGFAQFDGRIIDVVTEGQWLDPGSKVRVIAIAGNTITVAEITA
jgi:membrane-bound serine protease (ClpP class)